MDTYQTYKDSGIEWVGEIPKHWEKKRFKSCFNLISEKLEDDLPKVGLENIESWTGKYLETSTEFEGDGDVFQVNDILYGKLRPYLAKVLLASFSGKAVGDIFVFRSKNELLPGYAHKLILSKNFIEVTNSSTFGSKMPRVSWEFISNLEIPIPTKSEQTAIANYLDRKTTEIDQLIIDKKHLVQLYKEEKTAIINQAVTKGINPDAPMKDSGIEWLGEIPEHWEVKRFKYYFDLISVKSKKELKKIGLENIESQSGKFIPTNTEFQGEGVWFVEEDILFGKLRPYLAKVWLASFEGKAVGDFYVFRAKDEVIPEFAQNRILDKSFVEITNNSTYGAKMPRVNWDFIANLDIAFPLKTEQTQIVQHIEKETKRIDTKIARAEKYIALLTEYRTALISEVVTGKVKVTD